MLKQLLTTTAIVICASAAHAQTTTPTPGVPAPAPSTSMPAPAANAPMDRSRITIVTKPQANDEWRSSKLVGLGVYNSANEKVGTIDDLIMNGQGQISTAVIGVGGFLSIGAKDVAVDFKSLAMARDENNRPIARLEVTKDQLKAAPDYVFLKDVVTPAPASDPTRRPAR